MKRIIIPIICIFTLFLTYLFKDEISNLLVDILDKRPEVVVQEDNDWTRDYDFYFVKQTEDWTPYGYQDLLNIIYSALNNGWDSFTFYCPKEYTDCVDDIKVIVNDSMLLTNIANFVHPYNTFSDVTTTYDGSGEITLNFHKMYTDEKIKEIDAAIDKFSQEKTNESMSNEEKIRLFHDYVIENASYDLERIETGISSFDSNTAYGSMVQNRSVCGGYSDAMAIYLNRLGIKNFKIASDTHVWNAVYLDNKWTHLDLTWDDPIGEDGSEYLLHKYYLIDTNTLLELDSELHNFDQSIYQEFK